MMCSAQICASRNSPASTHDALTSFHVRVEFALRAASTDAWNSPSRTRQVARRAKLEMEVNMSFAGTYISSA